MTSQARYVADDNAAFTIMERCVSFYVSFTTECFDSNSKKTIIRKDFSLTAKKNIIESLKYSISLNPKQTHGLHKDRQTMDQIAAFTIMERCASFMCVFCHWKAVIGTVRKQS